MEKITYLSDCGREYSNAIGLAATLPDLLAVLEEYEPIASDALAARPTTEEEFEEWRRGLAMDRRGEFAGHDWMARYGAVLLPALVQYVGHIATAFHAPWGAAFLRMVEGGYVEIDGRGIARTRSL